MKLKSIFAAGALALGAISANAAVDEAKMNAFIDELMGKMTLRKSWASSTCPPPTTS